MAGSAGFRYSLRDLPHKTRVLIDGEGREGRDAILNSVRKLIELGYLVDEDDLTPAHE
ncbi:hypothetical protein M2302_005784 [Micromonospora sp. A200]|nr:hypothetical protein [Micromonospora sp. A200]